MSEAQAAASPAPEANAPPPQAEQTPPPSGNDQGSSPPSNRGTTIGGEGEGSASPGTPPAEKTGEGGDDSWRQRYVGDDDSRLTQLTRYKSEDDFIKSVWEAKAKVGEKQAGVLPDNATPDQLSEYRQANGIPEKSEEYGLTTMENVELTEVEKGMFGEFEKLAHTKNMPVDLAKEISEFYLQSRDADVQALNKVDEDLKETWGSELKSEYGKDFENLQGAANAWLSNHFGDNDEAKANLVNARLPGGGLLGDSPEFFKMVTDLALQNGFGDAIEANESETASGQSLAEQQRTIEALQGTDPAKYDEAKTQARLDRIIELRMKRGEIDNHGREIKKRS